MLRSVNELLGYIIEAEDDEVGFCHDFLFEDRPWIIRYMVTDILKWIVDRKVHKKVLVSLIALGSPDWETFRFPVQLTRQQVEESPLLDDDAPVSREYEQKLFNYHAWPYYWLENDLNEAENEAGFKESRLRSVKEVTGYTFYAEDSKIGNVEDFIVDDQIWSIRYVVANINQTRKNREVLIAPDWIKSVSWTDRKVSANMSAKQIRKSPAFDPSLPINRDYEGRLYDYYGRPYYWE